MAVLNGTFNSDFIVGTSIADIIQSFQGNNIVRGIGGNDYIEGGEGNDELSGNQGDDILIGGRGSDTLFGGQGNDNLSGNEGDDFLYGNRGSDILSGETGNDVFVIGTETGSSNLADADIIIDFSSSSDNSIIGRGRDFIGLVGGQTFENLNIFQGLGDNTTNTIFQDKTTGNFLAILLNTDASALLSRRDLFTSVVPPFPNFPFTSSPLAPLPTVPLAQPTSLPVFI